MKSANIFDPILDSSSKPDLRDKIDRYLSTDTETVQNVLLWWWERRAMYPCLSQMALDYLSIPGMVQLFYLLHQPHNLLKLPLLTLNGLSAVADSYLRTFGVGYLHKLLVLCFASAAGAYKDISIIRTFVLLLLCLMSKEMKRNSKKIGIKFYYNVICVRYRYCSLFYT